jgi:hypothetical protein
MAAFLKWMFVAACFAMLGGCVPHFTTYVHLRTSEISPTPCGTAGPPVFARYEREGTHFEVTLEPGLVPGARGGFMRITPPPDSTVIIEDYAGYLSRDDGGPRIPFTLKLAPFPDAGGITELRFDFEGLPAKIDLGGTLHLPDIVVNGKTVVAPVFEFYQERYAGAATRGCT